VIFDTMPKKYLDTDLLSIDKEWEELFADDTDND